jgi:Xaa-Pro aminopeptidase
MGSRSLIDRPDRGSGSRSSRHEEVEAVMKSPSQARVGRLERVELPEFGSPATRPDLLPELYRDRLARLRERAEAAGYERLVVYADREHSANLAWLTGFDPRFEEAVAIVGPTDEPALLVGNEDWGTAGAAPLALRRHLFQDLSLPSQPRDRSRPLEEILAEEGIRRGSRVGVVGWKPFGDPSWLDVPSYLADAIRSRAGATGRVENAVGLFIDASEGLRVGNEVDRLAAFEAAACRTSGGVRRLIHELRPGMTEREAVALLGWDGSPLSCHLMLTAGPRARFGLLSPDDRPIEHGDPFTTAFGIWGALNCRAGWVVEGAGALPGEIRDYVDRLVGPYFGAIAEWYAALRVGQTGGVLHEIIARRLSDPFFGIFLNPGHQISLDEWVNSPIGAGSTTELRSGMYLQVDVIPATGSNYFTTNIEDGVALGDDTLRAELAADHPEMWARIQARRRFMADQLGIELHRDVLPFSNLAAWLPPFLLDPSRAMTVA